MHDRTNTYQNYAAHIPSLSLFHPNTSQLNPFQANSLQPNIQTNAFQPNVLHTNTLQPGRLQRNHFHMNPLQPNAFAQNLHKQNLHKQNLHKQNLRKQNLRKQNLRKQNLHKQNLHQPNTHQPNTHRTNTHRTNTHKPNPIQLNPHPPTILQPKLLQLATIALFLGHDKRTRHHVTRYRQKHGKVTSCSSSSSSPDINGYHFSNTNSDHSGSHNGLSSTEIRPKKRARRCVLYEDKTLTYIDSPKEMPIATIDRDTAMEISSAKGGAKSYRIEVTTPVFEQTSNIEAFFYDDIIYSILSFLSVENLSVVMRVSQRFNKNARKARRNTTKLVVNCMTNCKDYVNMILGNCSKVKTLELEQSLLSKAQICTILEHCAATLVSIDTICSQLTCFQSNCCGKPLYPLQCRDFFMSYLVDTLKNLRSFAWGGCFQVEDLLYFARSCRSLEECCISFSHDFHGVDVNIAMECVKIILFNNPNLHYLSLGGFAGAGEILLRRLLPECSHLKNLDLIVCKVMPQTRKLLEEKLPMVAVRVIIRKSEL